MYGLVLEGGGAKGAYQVGAVKALFEMGFKFNAITGTSIGAINGAFLALNKFDELYNIWEEAEILNVVDTDKELLSKILDLEFKSKDIPKIIEYVIKTIEDGGFDINPLRQMLIDNINEEELRESKIDFGLVTVSFTDFKPIEVFIKDIPKGKLIEYIIASASLPIFKLDKIDGKKFIDGGFYDNMPVNLISQKDIKDIIVIGIEGTGRKRKIKRDDLNIIKIAPSKKISRTIETDPEIIREGMQYGYLDAYRVIEKYNGTRYYIKTDKDEDFFINKILKLSDKKIKRLYKLFNIEMPINKRILVEVILPILGKILKLDEECSYVELFISLNEKIAEYFEVDDMKLYQYNEFNKMLIEKTNFNEVIKFTYKYKYIPFAYLPQQIEVLPKSTVKKILKEFFIIMYIEEGKSQLLTTEVASLKKL
ncbi:MAG: patatin-like phospholipase family protein [Bacillota bacterium]|nr:patatin-like phospholipase family protein [Bacillota bacterium]